MRVLYSPARRAAVLATVALAVSLVAGCAPQARSAGAAAPEADRGTAGTDTLLTLDRSRCFGTCPSYHLTVFEDGRVVYVGRAQVTVRDTARARLDSAAIGQLAEQFLEADYFAYRRNYGRGSEACEAFATDHPTVRTSFRWKGRRQQVQHYHGCYARAGGGGPQRTDRLAQLAALEDTVDAIVGTARWTGEGR